MKNMEETMSTVLDDNGYPKNPSSIFVGIQRQFFPHMEEFAKSLRGERQRISIPVRRYGRWEMLSGKAMKITNFKDGSVIHYPQDLDNSFLKWPDAILWVPNHGPIGILNT